MPAVVSIITVSYNSADTIRDTMESVAAQTYPHLEYIVVDGASTDGTVDIIRDYADQGIIDHWISESDDGIADAFNKGIAMASGEYIQILNSDDWLHHNQVEIAANYLYQNKDVGFVYGDLHRYDQSGSNIIRKMPGKPDEIGHNVPRLKYMPHPSFVVRETVYDQVGLFDTKYGICMDLEWVMRAKQMGIRADYIPSLKSVMRDGGVSNRYHMALWKEKAEILFKYNSPKWPTFKILGSHMIKLILRYYILNPIGLFRR
jgi:glycosyltransferase involved in cell wall biosynthesis